ncbi:MAG: hypothetical protein JWM68_5702 [Verrucomicrobiales bacterium]|nr:hypothetical protein [Verrucomicrobiales bacterium]
MAETTDIDLLREYAERSSEPAFAALVQRHINLVYSVALRYVGNSHDAQDVTQAVFLLLAQKAATLRERTILTGWLYESTRFTAARFLRSKMRRQFREQEAHMQSSLNDSDTDEVWQRLAPLLEEAMSGLSEKDRTLLALRFFENKSAEETATTLGIQEWAARKRVARAVEKLRTFFARRGVSVSAVALVGAISAHSIQAAPVALAATISTATTALIGTTLANSATVTATKAIAMTTLQKLTITAALAIVAGAGIQQAYEASQLRDQVQMLRQQQAPLAEQIQREQDDATKRLASLPKEKSRDTELLKLRAEVTALRQTARERATTESVTGAWATRIALLKQRLDQMPDKRIPEMAFLTEKDWAAATRDADLSTDDGARQAMSALRSAAKDNFLGAMREAFKKFAAAANGGDLPSDWTQLAQAINANAALLPSDLAQLKPYFDVPVEDATLQRYKFVRLGKMHDNLSDVLVRETAPPVDTEYDTHHDLGLESRGVRSVNLIADAVAAAAKDYAQANNGQMPSDPAQIAPYLKQPLEAALVEKYLRKLPTDPAVPGK